MADFFNNSTPEESNVPMGSSIGSPNAPGHRNPAVGGRAARGTGISAVFALLFAAKK
ncbi:MAG: hypothetical protein SF052_18690 [Bacteroidia bacterium]|nr:hypothetical protein [Bacteroidia bacterium]